MIPHLGNSFPFGHWKKKKKRKNGGSYTLRTHKVSLFFPIPCPVDDLQSEITSAKEQVEEISQGKREASSSPGNVRVLVLIK